MDKELFKHTGRARCFSEDEQRRSAYYNKVAPAPIEQTNHRTEHTLREAKGHHTEPYRTHPVCISILKGESAISFARGGASHPSRRDDPNNIKHSSTWGERSAGAASRAKPQHSRRASPLFAPAFVFL